MSNTSKGDALSVVEIMESKGWNKDEIRELAEYLDGRVLELQRPFKRGFKIAIWVYCITLVAILTLPDQALLIGIKLLFSLIP